MADDSKEEKTKQSSKKSIGSLKNAVFGSVKYFVTKVTFF
jgi:hypothetical protein